MSLFRKKKIRGILMHTVETAAQIAELKILYQNKYIPIRVDDLQKERLKRHCGEFLSFEGHLHRDGTFSVESYVTLDPLPFFSGFSEDNDYLHYLKSEINRFGTIYTEDIHAS